MAQDHQKIKDELAKKQAEAREEALLSSDPTPEPEKVVVEHTPVLSSPSSRIQLKTIAYLSLFVSGFSLLVFQSIKVFSNDLCAVGSTTLSTIIQDASS